MAQRGHPGDFPETRHAISYTADIAACGQEPTLPMYFRTKVALLMTNSALLNSPN
jgi:hypothetical protein